MVKEELIIITIERGRKMFFRYLEDVAEWLGRVHNRTINIADELEAQITDINGCEFEIDDKKYYYQQITLNKY